jgi:hypothetical protein
MADSRSERLRWAALSNGSAVLGAVATRKLLQALWPAGDDATGPPFNPADRRVGWPLALQWGVAAGVGAGIARVISQRAAAAGWEAATGTSPPGLKT